VTVVIKIVGAAERYSVTGTSRSAKALMIHFATNGWRKIPYKNQWKATHFICSMN
jgi:hypothetical protein